MRKIVFSSGFLVLLSVLFFTAKSNAQTQTKRVVGTEVGNIAPDLEYQSPQGENIKLSSLRGKMVLVDFWASWCPPCRRENPNVVEAYTKFNDKTFKGGKGFTIYGVSLDKSKESWINAIETDKLVWQSHVSDLGFWDSKGAKIYGVQSIPSNVLLDGDGVIIAKNLRAENLHTFLQSLVVD